MKMHKGFMVKAKTMTILLGLVSLVPAFGFASSPYESEIKDIIIRYTNESSIAVVCDSDSCGVQIILGGKNYKFVPADLKGEAIPSQPILYSENNLPEKFSFEVKLDCERSGFPPSSTGICAANYSVEKGKISRVSKFEIRSGTIYPLRKLNEKIG